MRKLLLCLYLGASFAAAAQTTYLPLRTEEYHLLDRLETKSGVLSDELHTMLKPIPRKGAVAFLKAERRIGTFQSGNLSNIDMFNISRAISISGEWAETADGDDGAIPSKRPVLKYFYQKQPDLIHVSNDDLYLVVNPVLYVQGAHEQHVSGLRYTNTRGAEIRGRLLGRVGFYTCVAENQEKPISYISAWEQRFGAFPGLDYYASRPSGAYDYIMARGYVDADAFDGHFNVTFGYDKQFTGDGIRSLFLSDYSAPATFLRLRTKVGKLLYENLYLELTPDYQRGGDWRLPRKYASIHQLSINAADWLNVGIFESTIFSKKERFGFEYLIPVMFYNTLARALGADQKTSLGVSFKAIALQHLQFYGQGYFDQLKLSELGGGWWGSQFGLQLGLKYFDAFSLKNLDLQAEANIVRPFTYAANDSISDYTHYNQPLAHPYGAGFAEFIGVARYQPWYGIYIAAKGIYSLRGADLSGPGSFGTDIFGAYDNRVMDNGFSLTPGQRSKGLYLNVNVAWELRPNIFLEAGASSLQQTVSGLQVIPASTSFYGGIRWNIARKEYDNY